MAIALHASSRLGGAAHKAVDKHLNSLDKMLAGATEADVDEVIHDTRTGMKRMRAFLRLIRPAIGKHAYFDANAHSKALAGALSGSRDARVLLDTVDLLLLEVEDRECRARLREPFSKNYSQTCDIAAGTQPLRQARQRLRSLQHRARHWRLKRYDYQALMLAIETEYGQGRRHWLQIQQHPDAEALHAWRKEVKRFYYQVSLLFPRGKKTQRARLKDLGEYLGQLHDLHILLEYIASHRSLFWAEDLSLLELTAQRREQALMDLIWRLAPKAYGEPAPSYSRKLIKGWRDLRQKKH
ncbi:CHAD domain-containing protein [Pontibacterium granulatum]|uniref:CHAD domain-containing protein n=1 Tax=Pontibacterium granulatum TaxID=2036029 RepID=UPI002499D6A4|nr:CHAD domain-containing protein [Pontibacterium granulatum]MDI3325688.1 CHAD domain-containing protein [Pontibacterium granulatum]